MPIEAMAPGAGGPEWSIAPLEFTSPSETASSTPGEESGGFRSALSDAVGSLARTQDEAASAAQALASGQAADPTAVVMAVERAQLAMQLAGQLRTKGVEALNDILHTQV